MKRIAIMGFGQRGRTYGDYLSAMGACVSSVIDPDESKRNSAKELYHLDDGDLFESPEEFFARGKTADALIISTMDQQHYTQAMRALDLRYPLLLEKPISNDPSECLRIRDKARSLNIPVTVCHVLRYSPFFRKIKSILDSGELGRVVTIQHNENIGNFHIAHSYVRGNWRCEAETAPIILAKSCHDFDILLWLTGLHAKKVASFGELTYFKPENAPIGSGERCCECPVSDKCRFDAKKAYLPVIGEWPATVLTLDQSPAGIMKAIQDGPYGRCVYRCDNDVCDHQVTIIRFEGGVTATFNLSGFTDKFCRTMKIMCEDGEIRARMDLNEIEVTRFASSKLSDRQSVTYVINMSAEGHGGGDAGLVRDFINAIENGSGMSSAIENSVESHVLAMAAETARKSDTVIDLTEYEHKLLSETVL